MELIKKLLAVLPLNKIKLYLSLAGVILIAMLILNLRIVINKNAKLAEDNRRLTANQIQLTGEKRQIENYVFRQSEIIGTLRAEVEKLADSLRVKPKYITRIEYRTITEKDTVIKEVFVAKVTENTWAIQDTGKCHIWSGSVTILTDDSISVKRTGFSYHNKITDTYYQKRPKGFWGFLKKRVNYHAVSSECGEPSVVTFEFIK